MPPDHFRNGKFFNPGVRASGFADLIRWQRTRKPGPWPDWIPSEPGPKPPAQVEGDALRVTFVNHSTVLLQTAGLNLLTDPIWSERASPLRRAGPRRHRAPGIRFDDLPPIDAVLLSHNHYDHLDTGTLRALVGRDRPEIFCPLGLRAFVKALGFERVHELDWGESVAWRGLEMHCVQAQHFSARSPFDRDRTLWCGWLADDAGGAIYFAGDSGFGPHFSALAEQFPSIRLALLPIGAYKPEWFMAPVHMSPDQALEAHRILRARHSMAIHFGTFSLADDGQAEPTDRLRSLLGEAPAPAPFWILAEGEARDVPPAT